MVTILVLVSEIHCIVQCGRLLNGSDLVIWPRWGIIVTVKASGGNLQFYGPASSRSLTPNTYCDMKKSFNPPSTNPTLQKKHHHHHHHHTHHTSSSPLKPPPEPSGVPFVCSETRPIKTRLKLLTLKQWL